MKGKIKISLAAEKWAENLWVELMAKIARAKSEAEIKNLFEKLITEDERMMILKRLAIIALVRSGKSYKEISEILWLSPNTISTIKKNLFGNHKNYKSYLAFYGGPKKYSQDGIKNKKSFWEDLFNDIDLWEVIKNPPRPVGMGIKQHVLRQK